jgi:hypothetical protein
MSSSSNKRQTMAKIARERTLREKRALKQEKKENRRLAALAASAGEGPEVTSAEGDEDAVEAPPPAEATQTG